jgi:hypothetical protein
MTNPATRAEEVAPHRVSLVAVVFTHQGDVHRVGQQLRTRGVEHGHGCRGQPVQHPLNTRRDVGGHRALPRRNEASGVEHVRALGGRQAQRPAQRLDDLFGGIGRTTLFEAGDVVDRDSRQLCELLATQPRRTPMTADRQPGGLRGQPVAPAPQRMAQLRRHHHSTVRRRAPNVLVLAVLGRRDAWMPASVRRIVET